MLLDEPITYRAIVAGAAGGLSPLTIKANPASAAGAPPCPFPGRCRTHQGVHLAQRHLRRCSAVGSISPRRSLLDLPVFARSTRRRSLLPPLRRHSCHRKLSRRFWSGWRIGEVDPSADRGHPGSRRTPSDAAGDRLHADPRVGRRPEGRRSRPDDVEAGRSSAASRLPLHGMSAYSHVMHLVSESRPAVPELDASPVGRLVSRGHGVGARRCGDEMIDELERPAWA